MSNSKKLTLQQNKDYMLYYPPTSSSYGLLLGNGDRIPKEWVRAGDKIVSSHTCEKKGVYCPPELVERVQQEVIEPSREAARRYVHPY